MPPKPDIPENYQDPAVATGQAVLPRSRVMKVLKTDEDVYQVNKAATHLVSVAAEMFTQYLAEQGVKSLAAERKQRKTVQYRDLASAVARTDNLEFLSDVIPQVVVARQTRETKTARSKKSTTEAGQRKLTELMNPKPARVSPTPEPEAADNEDVVME